MELHTNGLLPTFVMSLVAAFAGGLAARAVGLPPLLGYILAGIALGPFSPGFVADQNVVSELAEVGVALMLFNIGLHFSLKDLIAVRKIAVTGAVLQIVISCTLGTVAALALLQCSFAAALIIGLCFSIASTAVSTRLLAERRQLSTLTGHIALGWLVVQDIAIILAMVVLPVLVKTENPDIASLAPVLGKTLLQVTGFVVVVLFGGRKFIPRMLGYVARSGSRELFTLAVIVIALGIAYGASMVFGVSLALGAFFAGVVIGESDLNHHAAAEALSMQQIFTILFFVSVGMLFDPQSVVRMPWEIATFWAVVFSMGLVTFCILLTLRVPASAAALVGGAFTQIGEFSFVFSQLGYQWGVLSLHNRDLILVVAITSIVLNPIAIRAFPALGAWLDRTQWMMRRKKIVDAFMPHETSAIADHVILIGHGRVGRTVAGALRAHDIPHVTIETDRRLMEGLRDKGARIIYGDATHESVLMAAHLATARLVIVAVPDGELVRRIVMLIKRLAPTLEIIVRVHEDAEYHNMGKLGVGLAVMGEREIALGLSAHALQFYGVESGTVLETLTRLRQHALKEHAQTTELS